MSQVRTRDPLVRLLTVIAVVALAAFAFQRLMVWHDSFFDLRIYMSAVNWWGDGHDLYDYAQPDRVQGALYFTYPPFAALLLFPFGLLPLGVTQALFTLGTVAAVVVTTYWLVAPLARRQGWPAWYAVGIGAPLVLVIEPLRETITFGQINMLLILLVLTDLLVVAPRWPRLAGIGIGLAAAIKLTPAIFICYLLVTRRWRAAATASGVAITATLLALWAAPDASRVYWTEAMWDTDRVGSLAYVSNQSWQGVLARLSEPGAPSRLVWAVGVIVLLCVWAWRARRAVAAGDEMAGFALTGLAACLISPVTWVHHLVWLFPALAVLADAGLRHGKDDPRRRRLLRWAVAIYVVLCSSVVWLWSWDATGVDGFLGSNTYVWISLGLLLALPLREGAPAAAAHPLPQPAGSATMGACAHATEYPWESRQSARPASPTPPASRPAPSASDG
jgi:alpha-1,2-mannosyltransferase